MISSENEWWERCRFIQDYFLGPQRPIAHQLAVQLAAQYVSDRILALRPDTNLPTFLGLTGEEYKATIGALLCPGVTDSLSLVELLMAVEEETERPLMIEIVTFKDVVRAAQLIRLLSI